MRPTPLTRKTPLKRTEMKRKNHVKAKAKRVSAKTLIKRADDLARAYCYELGGCVACDYTFGTRIAGCSGRIEWAHLKSRGNKTIRHDPLNFVPLCFQHHRWFTLHPDEWTRFIEGAYPGRWDRLNAILQDGGKPDYDFWIGFYEGRTA